VEKVYISLAKSPSDFFDGEIKKKKKQFIRREGGDVRVLFCITGILRDLDTLNFGT
jgi:hypothetical protein